MRKRKVTDTTTVDPKTMSQLTNQIIWKKKKGYWRGRLSKQHLLPIGAHHPEDRSAPVKFVVFCEDSDPTNIVDRIFPESVETLVRWIEVAKDQYTNEIAPQTVAERLTDYFSELFEEKKWNLERVNGVYAERGLHPFLQLHRVTVFDCKDHKSAYLQFDCDIEEYLESYGFCIRWMNSKVEFSIDEETMQRIERLTTQFSLPFPW